MLTNTIQMVFQHAAIMSVFYVTEQVRTLSVSDQRRYHAILTSRTDQCETGQIRWIASSINPSYTTTHGCTHQVKRLLIQLNTFHKLQKQSKR